MYFPSSFLFNQNPLIRFYVYNSVSLSLAASQAWPTAYPWELGVCIPSAPLSPSVPSTMSCQDKSGQTPRKRVTSCPPFTMCQLHWPPAHVSVHDSIDSCLNNTDSSLSSKWIGLEFYKSAARTACFKGRRDISRLHTIVFWFKMRSESHQQQFES